MRRQKMKSRVRHRNGLRIYLKMFRNMRKSNIFMSRLSGEPSIRKVERTIRIFIVCCKMGESVCAGYAKTMQYLAGKVGILSLM